MTPVGPWTRSKNEQGPGRAFEGSVEGVVLATFVVAMSGLVYLPIVGLGEQNAPNVLAQGALVGVITLTDLFCALNNHPVYLAARIRRQPDQAGVGLVGEHHLAWIAVPRAGADHEG